MTPNRWHSSQYVTCNGLNTSTSRAVVCVICKTAVTGMSCECKPSPEKWYYVETINNKILFHSENFNLITTYHYRNDLKDTYIFSYIREYHLAASNYFKTTPTQYITYIYLILKFLFVQEATSMKNETSIIVKLRSQQSKFITLIVFPQTIPVLNCRYTPQFLKDKISLFRRIFILCNMPWHILENSERTWQSFPVPLPSTHVTS